MLVADSQVNDDTISVMMIDDNPDDLMIMTQRLARIANSDYFVTSFADVPSALISLETSYPAVCLVDFNLGLHTAFDFIDGLKNTLGETVPVVVITGVVDDRLDEKLMLAGADDYWSKDELTPRLLERCINYAYHRHLLMSRYRAESQRKSVHLANMAHELKQPLNSIQGFAKRLLKVMPNSNAEAAEDCIRRILRNSKLLDHLIHELLDLSHIESGTMQINTEAYDLDQLLQTLVDDFSHFAQDHNLALSYNKQASPLTVVSDPQHMHQVLSNLISNAIKYTEQGEVELSCLWQQHKTLGNCITVDIKDSGIGIRAEDLDNVFSPYKQVHKSLNKDVDSTGLGLPISLALIQRQGGLITVQSTLGRGSVFTVWLPQAEKM